MNAQPLVTVLIRTRDRKDLLQETLASVMAQTCASLEVLIINDGGEDFSAEIIAGTNQEGFADKNSSVRWINNTGDHGRSIAANLGLDEASGKYCLFLDDDDTIEPTHLEGLLSALDKNPSSQIAYSATRTMANGVVEDTPSFAFPFDPIRLMIENTIPIHSVLFERALVGDKIRFDPAFDRFEDWDFWLQLAEHHEFLFVDSCTATYRIDSASGFGAKAYPQEAMDTYRIALYRKWLQRWPDEKILALLDRSREFPRIADLENTTDLLNQNIDEKLQFINDLNARLDDRDRLVLEQQEQITETETELQSAVNETKSLEVQVQHYQNELDVVYNSRSWRLTRPLRAITRIRYFLRTEGPGGLAKRILMKLAARTSRVNKIIPDSPVSDQFTPLSFPEFEKPEHSIVIPVFNNYQYTFHCLKSILEHAGSESFEVIVVNDCSSDQTTLMLEGISGIRVVNNKENQGFINSCNTGAEHACGEYLTLLNNDTEVREGWLAALRQTFRDFPDAGMVGARLVFANGTLQEAGGIVWRDGSAWNYGRGDDPNKPEYTYCRQVDYCSGACLMLPLSDYRALGGFDTYYIPAYYEDTDLAFKIRKSGKKVYYQPNSTIIHFEGITSGTDPNSGAKKYQGVNHDKFVERWRQTLESHRPNGMLPNLEKEKHVKKRILVIDARVLMPDHDSGSLRMFNILKILQDLDYKVSFVPANLHYHEKYTPQMQALGIECQYLPYVRTVSDYLEEHGMQFDAVILSRADYAEKYMDAVRQFCPQARVLFDTVDLHFLREEREAELSNDKALMESAAMRKNQELALARKADITLVVSPVEIELFAQEAPDVNIALLSNIHANHDGGAAFGERRDMLFIGNFEHPPNTDAMEFFLDEIFPLVETANPDIKLKIVGGHVPSHLKARAKDNIEFTGFVEDISELFDSIRLSIAPLRYGAGVKGKINSSMSYGVPAVVSTIAAEGMNLVHEQDILIADQPEDFAREILKLYDDENLWLALSKAGKENIEKHFSFATAEAQLKAVLESN